jgi:hypothetical protein
MIVRTTVRMAAQLAARCGRRSAGGGGGTVGGNGAACCANRAAMGAQPSAMRRPHLQRDRRAHCDTWTRRTHSRIGAVHARP